MAVTGLLMLLDDITTLLDDVALMTKTAARQSSTMADDVLTMTKVATQKTAGVLGDDLALNAEQVAGVHADRELAVVWAVAKGSLLNKLVLVPAALLISVLVPGAITPLLMLGGAFLCYEGVEKVLHSWRRMRARRHGGACSARSTGPLPMPQAGPSAHAQVVGFLAMEKAKVRGAVRTDFILSAEIIAIVLGTVADEPLTRQAAVLALVAVLVTVLVYGLVALIVRLDDVGLALLSRASTPLQFLGRGILQATPWLMRTLSIVGTAAMFFVGGSLLVHGLPAWGQVLDTALVALGNGPLWQLVLPQLMHLVSGALVGAAVLACVAFAQRLRSPRPVAPTGPGQ